MTSTKYIGLDVHQESISIAVLNSAGKVVMECVIETKASTLLQFIHGLGGDVHLTFKEGTWAGWLYDLLKAHVTELVVCNPRKNALLKEGSKSDRIDARKLAALLYMSKLSSVYHGEHGLRMRFVQNHRCSVTRPTRSQRLLQRLWKPFTEQDATRRCFRATRQIIPYHS
jgi:hypothetical protein